MYVHEYLEAITIQFDMSVDINEIENIAVYSRDTYDLNKFYIAGLPFAGYLINC